MPDGFALTFLVLAAALYARGCAGPAAARRPVAGRAHASRWMLGLLVFAWATVGGLGLYSHVLFSAHMVAHMLLSMVAPIGLVLGAPVTLALRALPGPRVPGELGRASCCLPSCTRRSRGWSCIRSSRSRCSSAASTRSTSRRCSPTLMGNHLGHVVMEFHFLAVGFLFFFVLVGIDPTPVRLPPIARIGLLFAAMPFHAFFSIAIMGGDTVLARGYFRALDRPYSTDLLGDQHLGGGIGWALGELPVAAGARRRLRAVDPARRARGRPLRPRRRSRASPRTPRMALRLTTNSADTTPTWHRWRARDRRPPDRSHDTQDDERTAR